MSKLVKILGAIVAVVVLVAVALVILAKVLITPERVKETILPLAEKNLHRKIELGEINVSLFSGIELKTLKIYEPDQAEVFVSTDLVRLKYQLLPLLSMKVVIDEVRIEQPRIRVVRFADGRFNFSDMTAAEQTAGQSPASTQPISATPGSGPPISLLVSQVRVQNGELLFLDHVLNDQAPYRFDVKNLDVAADGITLSGAVPVKVQCSLNGSQLNLDGNVNLLQQDGAFDINLQGVDVLTFRPYFESKIPGRLGRMKLDLKTSVKGSRESVAAKGTLVFSDMDLVLNAMPEAPIQQGRLAIEHDLEMKLGPGQLELARLAVDFNGLKAEVRGVLNDLFDKPLVDLELVVPGVDLRQAMTSIPTRLVKDVKDLDPAGVVKVQAKLVGGVNDPVKLLQNATIDLDNVQATAAGYRPSLNGRLNLLATRVESQDLQLRMGDNTADIDLSVKDILGKPLVVTADLNSKRFLLDPLLKGSGGAAVAAADTPSSPSPQPAATPAAKTPAAQKELGPFDIPARASGTIRIDETVYKGLSIKDFIARYQLQDNVLTISQLDGSLAGGTFSNRARVDLGQKGLAYNADINIKAIQADPLLTAFVPKAAGALLGAMNLQMAVSGRGTQWETLSKKLGGQGDMLIADGRLVSPGLVKGFAGFLQMPDMNEIRFSNFQGAFKIVDGKLQVNSQMISPQIKLAPKGAIGLDGSLSLSLDTRLSPEVAGRLDQKGQVTQYLKDKEGWSQLPLMVSGSIAAPKFGLDASAVKAQATQALSRELEGQIDKLFQKKQPADSQGEQAPQETQAEDPAQKALKDSLKKLFGN